MEKIIHPPIHSRGLEYAIIAVEINFDDKNGLNPYPSYSFFNLVEDTTMKFKETYNDECAIAGDIKRVYEKHVKNKSIYYALVPFVRIPLT